MSLPTVLDERLDARRSRPRGRRGVVAAALAEDLAGGVDVTSVATCALDAESRWPISSRGRAASSPGFRSSPPCCGPRPTAVDIDERVRRHASGVSHHLLSATGATRALLTAERTALNLLGHLSGIATLTRAWVDAIAGSGAAIRDTRKTTPGLRALEKYAVRCGGGMNHRMSLSDAALIKDNHVVAAGGVAAAFRCGARGVPEAARRSRVRHRRAGG